MSNVTENSKNLQSMVKSLHVKSLKSWKKICVTAIFIVCSKWKDPLCRFDLQQDLTCFPSRLCFNEQHSRGIEFESLMWVKQVKRFGEQFFPHCCDWHCPPPAQQLRIFLPCFPRYLPLPCFSTFLPSLPLGLFSLTAQQLSDVLYRPGSVGPQLPNKPPWFISLLQRGCTARLYFCVCCYLQPAKARCLYFSRLVLWLCLW